MKRLCILCSRLIAGTHTWAPVEQTPHCRIILLILRRIPGFLSSCPPATQLGRPPPPPPHPSNLPVMFSLPTRRRGRRGAPTSTAGPCSCERARPARPISAADTSEPTQELGSCPTLLSLSVFACWRWRVDRRLSPPWPGEGIYAAFGPDALEGQITSARCGSGIAYLRWGPVFID